MIGEGCDLQRVIAVLPVHRCVNREPLLEQLDHLVQLIPRDGPQHAVGVAVRENHCVLAVPRDGVVEVGEVVEEEGVGGVARKAGEPLVEVEGQPLRRAEDRVRVLEVKLGPFEVQHLLQSAILHNQICASKSQHYI